MRKIANNIYMIEAPKHGQYPYSNFLFIDDQIQTLVDTGWGHSSLEPIKNKKIDLILNSHFHRDHTGNNNAFAGAQVWAHHLDAPAIRSREAFVEYYGIGKLPTDKIDTSRSWMNISESPVHQEFQDNEVICLGDVELQVLHTPGHTPGHCAFFWEDERILYGGDIDLCNEGPFYGCAVSNINDFIKSIEKLRDLNPKVFISAHKGLIDTDIKEDLDKYLNRIYERELRILDNLNVPSDLETLTLQNPISGNLSEPRELFYLLEMTGVYHHLERLISAGLVVKDGEYYVKATSCS